MSASPREIVDVPESLVVLTHDVELLQTLRAVATEHQISTVGAEADLAAHLLEDHAGVAVLDTSAVTSPIAQLAERLKSQFPDLVLVVTGNLNDQNVLAAQITKGIVYRFLHKPVSEQRVRLFVNAAWRRHGVEHAEIIEATASNLRKPVWVRPQPTQKNLNIGIAAVAVVVIAGGVWFFARSSSESEQTSAATASAARLPAGQPTNDAELEKLLARADDAFKRGALTTPAGENAVEFYRQALKRQSDDPRANVGIENVTNQLLTAAEKALLENRVDEAARLTDIARSVQPDHVRVAFLTTQIGKERERALLGQARQAAARGRVSEAIAVLDNANLTGGNSSLMSQARSELEQRKVVDDRVSDFLRRASDRIRTGALVEPAQNNARFFIESARAIAPNDGDVRQAQRQLADRIVVQARSAINAGNADEADRWISAAGESGVARDDITSLTREAARMRIAARSESMAKLSQSFNQRLTQGRLVDPANDSAKFYLAQLNQTEAGHPSTQLARQALNSRLLDEARGAITKQDYAGAKRWVTEAREAGADESGTAALERDIGAAQDSSRRSSEIITASMLTRMRYSPPEYPTTARERGVAGWVDIIFTVMPDGQVGDLTVASAEPAGIFEQAALSAVRKWRYQPVQRDGRVVEQRARVRIRFAMEK
ncbi:MAG TPA: TonB family protein [Steroidobacteraceae bacterium]|nr:TonB family protein [Steroidobacteraceae bacterium]